MINEFLLGGRLAPWVSSSVTQDWANPTGFIQRWGHVDNTREDTGGGRNFEAGLQQPARTNSAGSYGTTSRHSKCRWLSPFLPEPLPRNANEKILKGGKDLFAAISYVSGDPLSAAVPLIGK
jgi:hypothetical protein